MTPKQIKSEPTIMKVCRYLQNGEIDLLDAVLKIDLMWREGKLCRADANKAVKLLARVAKQD